MVLLSVKDFERFCNEVISRFQSQRSALYRAEDIQRGSTRAPSPDGETVEYPLISVAGGAVTTERIRFQDSAQVVKVAGELNRRAQEQQNNGHIEILRQGILL